jgi:hypothetical protein
MDRTTKTLLAAIAAGLFLNAAAHLSSPARASDDLYGVLSRIETTLTAMRLCMCGKDHHLDAEHPSNDRAGRAY